MSCEVVREPVATAFRCGDVYVAARAESCGCGCERHTSFWRVSPNGQPTEIGRRDGSGFDLTAIAAILPGIDLAEISEYGIYDFELMRLSETDVPAPQVSSATTIRWTDRSRLGRLRTALRALTGR